MTATRVALFLHARCREGDMPTRHPTLDEALEDVKRWRWYECPVAARRSGGTMPDAFASGHVHAGILTVVTATEDGMVAASTRGGLTLHTRSLPGEERTALLIRAARDFAECERIAVTLAQPWPRLDGETPDPAQHWIAAGFRDAEVVAWMEAGVPWCSPAVELRDADVDPRKLAREWEPGVSLGLGFARGDLELEQVLREVG